MSKQGHTGFLFKHMKEDIVELGNAYNIIAGYFNLVMEPGVDTLNYLNINNPRARETLIRISNELSLVDVWRELNTETRSNTWTRVYSA